jgi:hypothetical protein
VPISEILAIKQAFARIFIAKLDLDCGFNLFVKIMAAHCRRKVPSGLFRLGLRPRPAAETFAARHRLALASPGLVLALGLAAISLSLMAWLPDRAWPRAPFSGSAKARP